MAGGVCAFSCCGQFLAVGQLDGVVKVWEAVSGKLQQRFSPGGPHASPAKCVVWSRQLDATPHKHKKRKANHLLLAVAKGNEVVVWNATKGEQQAVLSSAHSDVVNTMAWRRGSQVLYSGSSDQHVAEWSVDKGECITMWKADKHSVHCMCCSSEGTQLVTAGRSVKLWKLEDHSLLKKFTGHATPVRTLLFVSESLFLSSAQSDRVVNIWSGDKQDSTAAASLTCEEEVMSFDITVVESEQVLQVAVISDEGSLSLFKFPLTNHVTAPVSAHSTVQFVSTTQKGDTPSPLPVLATRLSPAGVSLAHTSSLRPCFETIDFHQSETRVCLVREPRGGLLLGRSAKKKSGKASSEDSSVTLLGPGNMTLPAPSSQPANRIPEDIPMSDRLPSGETARQQHQTRSVSATSLSHLLAQGLRSGDKQLLEEVFAKGRSNKTVVLATVKQLPVQSVIPLFRYLIDQMQKCHSRGGEFMVWVSAVLQTHSAYLMTVPHLLDSLSGFYQLLDARLASFSKLCRVQGKLELLLAQGAHEEADTGGGAMSVLTTPLLALTAGESSVELDRTESPDEEDWNNDSGSASEGTDQSGGEESDQSEEGSEEEMETDAQQGELT